MGRVADLLKSKPSNVVYSISPDADALVAVRMMAELNIGALVVMERGQLVGILSERDVVHTLAREGALGGNDVLHLMSTPVKCVREDQSSEECMGLMTQARIRHLPVLGAGDEVVGLLSIGDLVKDTISGQAFVIEQLEHYIMGSPS